MKRFVKTICLIFTVLTVVFGFSMNTFAYKNPILLQHEWKWNNGTYYGSGDPYVLKYNGVYYLYVSTVDDKSGIKVWSSKNLVDWKYEGLCTTDPVTKAAYAPEVTYWNGYFYMYTSPGGQGHYVLRSTSPTGPFTVQTKNLGHSIDGSVFIDDDGKWYFYHAGISGIVANPMPDPYTFGEGTLTGSYMGGWTEGPTVFKRNGIYYMTYTGNHVWNRGYRVNYSTSGNPTFNFTSSWQNPVLINTEGPVHGTGHNSIIIGPDLDTYYMVYHSQADPGRHLNIDKIVWNGRKMDVLGPTSSEQPNPDLPVFSDYTPDSDSGNWLNTLISSRDNKKESESKHGKRNGKHEDWNTIISKTTTANNYTAEFNLLSISSQKKNWIPKYGVVFSYKNDDNYGVAILSPQDNELHTQFVVDGQKQGWQTSILPDGYRYSVLHKIRIQKSGDKFKIYVDQMLKQTRLVNLDGGSIGYVTKHAKAKFGYTAFSNKVNGSGAWDTPKPVPGMIEAVHYMSGGEGSGYHDKTDGNIGGQYRKGDVDIRLNPEGGYNVGWNQTGEWLKYKVNVAETGIYDVGVRVATTFKDAKIRIWGGSKDLTGVVDVPNTGGWNDWRTFTIQDLHLKAGVQELKVEIVKGEFDFKSLTFHKSITVSKMMDDFNDGNDDGWKHYEGTFNVDKGKYILGGSYAKAAIGSEGWADYSVETDITLKNTDTKAGILARVNNPADGSHLGNYRHFNQGYFAYITTNGVFLGKANYGWDYLMGVATAKPISINEEHHLKMVVNGINIKVYLDDMDRALIDYYDNTPISFTHGKVGVRTSNGSASFDNFRITPIS